MKYRAAHLLFGESWPYANDIYDVALDDANISKMAAAKRIELFALSFPLFLLLSQPSMTAEWNML